MADAIGAEHVQGAFEEGEPASGERPILLAGKDASGNLKVLVLDSSGNLLVSLTDAVILAPGSDTRNRIQATGDFIPLSVEQFAGQTHDLFVAWASNGTTKLARVEADGTISSPGSTTASERFGDTSSTTANETTALGFAAAAGAVRATAVGRSASATGIDAVAVGAASSVSADLGVAVGRQAAASADSAIAIGRLAAASGFHSVSIGASSATTANDAVGIGHSASGTDQCVSVGASATAIHNCVAVGWHAVANPPAGDAAVALGSETSCTGSRSTALGRGAAVAQNDSIAIGALATTTATNQWVVGNSSSSITNAYFGKGVTSTSPAQFTLQATGGSGANVAGAALALAGGRGTGSAVGGDLIFQSTYAGSAGSTLNTLHEVARVSQLGVLSFTQLTTGQDRTAFDITPSWATATDATRKGRAVFNVWDTAAREVMRIEASGTVGKFGAFGAAAVVQQTGASAAGIAAVADANAQAALQALQTAFANLGWVTSPA